MTKDIAIEFEEDSNRGRFFAHLDDGHLAEMTFVRNHNQMIIDHTRVPKQFEGQGIAAKLVVEGVEYARKNKRKIVPVCSYVVAQFKRHKDWADVLAA